MSASPPSRIKAASMSRRSRRTRAPTSTSPPESVGNRRHIVVSDQAGRSNILARLREVGIEVDPEHPKLARLLDEVKEREFAGYAYDGAEASFELLARRALGQRAGLFPAAELPRHRRAALECQGRARHRLRGDHQGRGRRRDADDGRRGQRPGQRARHGAPQGADRRLPRARDDRGSPTTRCAS